MNLNHKFDPRLGLVSHRKRRATACGYLFYPSRVVAKYLWADYPPPPCRWAAKSSGHDET